MDKRLHHETPEEALPRQAEEPTTIASQNSAATDHALLNDLFDHSAVGIFLLDAQFRVVWLNQVIETFFGIHRVELIGQDKRRLIRDRIQQIFADPQTFAKRVLASYDHNTKVEQFECLVLASDDRQERWLEHWSQPIRSGRYAGGRIEHYTDITARCTVENTLRASKERWQLIEQGSNDALWDWDLQHQTVFFSDRWREMRGLTQTEIDHRLEKLDRIGTWLSGIHPDDRSRVQTTLRQYFNRHIPRFAVEYRVRHQDGHYFWILDRGQAIWDETGQVTRMVGVETDITVRKNAEAALQKSEASLAEAQRLAKLGSWDWNVRDNELWWSEEMYRIFGLDPKTFGANYEAFFNAVHPDDRDLVQQAVDAALNQATPYSIDYRIVSNQGEPRTGHAQGEVIFDEHNQPLRMIGTVQDITARKQAEDALQYQLKLEQLVAQLSSHFMNIPTENLDSELQQALQTLGEFIEGDRHQLWLLSAPLPLYEHFSPDINHCKITFSPVVVQLTQQWSRPGIMNPDPIKSTLILNQVLPWLNQQIQRLEGIFLASLADLPTEAVLERRYFAEQGICSTLMVPLVYGRALIGYLKLDACQQPRTWNRDHFQLMRLVGEILVNALERSRTQDELVQRAQALERSNQDLEQFAYVASHDLQEPLRSIISYTELLKEDYQGQLNEEADEYIHFIIDGATRMKQLIQDLLAFSRVERRGKEFEMVSVEAVVQQVLKNLTLAIQESQATIDYGPLPTLIADPSQLVQLFQNLISNAIKFRTQTPPRIQIKAQQNAHDWQFAIRDNGIGIDPKYTKRIFSVFQRLHTRRQYPGTGIGLAICRKIVERHGGRIWVKSALEQGATFYFTIERQLIKKSQ